jgi:hypothetical protein
MTGPEESHTNTRPISVAELLAKNGTIGAPPVGGRRRRRRGNSDAVTVAELTGEIPIVTDDIHGDVHDEAHDQTVAVADEHVEATGPLPSNGAVETAAPQTAEVADAEADYAAHIDARDANPEPFGFGAYPRRGHYAHAARRFPAPAAGVGAEQMSPDPVDFDDDDEAAVAVAEAHTEVASPTETPDDVPSYLRSPQGPLFGGQSVADEGARRGVGPRPEDIDLDDEAETVHAPESRMSAILRGAGVVGQCIIAVAFGAGLFIAFDQLWKWNNIVALVLSVLVILGLVVGVRVVRKTEDIGSTLIAVAVGALVTLGPLALLQSN